MRTFTKNFILIFLCVLTAVFVFNFTENPITSNNINKINADTTFSTTKTIVIDAGHGGMDVGAIGKNLGLKESVVNLKIAKSLKNILLGNGYNVVMTRETEDGLYGDTSKGHKRRDMRKRKEIINSSFADLVISIHLNTCPYSYRKGAIAFYKINDEKSKELATFIQKNLNNNLYNMEKEQIVKGDFFILNCNKKPAVLIECGFLSNSTEEQNLANEKYLDKIATSIFMGINDFFSNSVAKI